MTSKICRDHLNLPVLGPLRGLEGGNTRLPEAFLALQCCQQSELHPGTILCGPAAAQTSSSTT